MKTLIALISLMVGLPAQAVSDHVLYVMWDQHNAAYLCPEAQTHVYIRAGDQSTVRANDCIEFHQDTHGWSEATYQPTRVDVTMANKDQPLHLWCRFVDHLSPQGTGQRTTLDCRSYMGVDE